MAGSGGHPGQGSADEFPYDLIRTPPAPILPLRLGLPQNETPLAVPALVDSGADITVLPEGLAAVVGLPQVGEVTVRGIGGTRRRARLYAAQVAVAGMARIIEVAEVGGEALLGRDVLNEWVVTLDGPRQVLRIDTGLSRRRVISQPPSVCGSP